MSSVRWPARARPAERFTATVDFPVPPFCVAIAMTLIDPYACVRVYVPTGSQAYTHTCNRYFRHYSKEDDTKSRGECGGFYVYKCDRGLKPPWRGHPSHWLTECADESSPDSGTRKPAA